MKINKRKKEKVEFLKNQLLEIGSLIGNSNLRLLLQRVLNELGKINIDIPENVLNIYFENFTEEEIDKIYENITALIKEILGEDYTKELEERWNEKFKK